MLSCWEISRTGDEGQFPPDKCATRLRYTPTLRRPYINKGFEARGELMQEQHETKTSDAAGQSGPESPVKSPVEVPDLSSRTSVYLIECAGYVKIGIARNPEKRLGEISVGTPVPARLHRTRPFATGRAARLAEAWLHRRFASRRSNREWFAVTPAEAWAALLQAPAFRLTTEAETDAAIDALTGHTVFLGGSHG